jgi:cytochrome c556
MNRFARGLLLGAALLPIACDAPTPDAARTNGTTAETPGPAVGPATDAYRADSGYDAAHEGMALLPIMRQMADDMAALQNALWLDGLDEVAARAEAVAEHAHLSADEVARVRAELGPLMAEFERADETVHDAAVRMHQAAREGNTDDLLDQLAAVQRGCVGCHVRFRERLRTSR